MTKELTQAAFAKRIGISLAALKLYEKGEREPKVQLLEKIIDLLPPGDNRDLSWLVTGEKRSDYITRIQQEIAEIRVAEGEIAYGPTVDLTTGKVLSTTIPTPSSPETIPVACEKNVTLNSSMLAQIIEGVDSVLEEKRLVITAGKKSELITLLYDYCSLKGSVEKGMIERQVKLLE